MSSTFNSSRRNSYFNEAKNPETGCGRTGSENAYGELEDVGEECKATCVPRKKANDLESAQQMSHRKRDITESSGVSTASTISTEIVQVKRESCLKKFILILFFSLVCSVIVVSVILAMYGWFWTSLVS